MDLNAKWMDLDGTKGRDLYAKGMDLDGTKWMGLNVKWIDLDGIKWIDLNGSNPSNRIDITHSVLDEMYPHIVPITLLGNRKSNYARIVIIFSQRFEGRDFNAPCKVDSNMRPSARPLYMLPMGTDIGHP
ncbi:hypothetical protein CDAR_51241 [Caerostris darwini]|uniref:Uncharacterized protein n=1 Tax=Caerostris darwini TaxID=1538125 RepID=A0AAV4U632_9ARAC|nr:hypothetical protein CDAR_51241 [Caerostris darwini]